jgi:hypothetical protein
MLSNFEFSNVVSSLYLHKKTPRSGFIVIKHAHEKAFTVVCI